MKERLFIYVVSMFLLLAVGLGINSCGMEEPSDIEEVVIEDVDSENGLVLYKGYKVDANTNFTMEQFEKELFSHETWETVTICARKNGKWNNNMNAIPEPGGWDYPFCYEFKPNGHVYIYDYPHYMSETAPYVWYYDDPFYIDQEHKCFYVGRAHNDSIAYGVPKRVLAVDDGRIIYETVVMGDTTRYSIEPYQITLRKEPYPYNEPF